MTAEDDVRREPTDAELRVEYQRLLNMLDRAPPEKLGMVVVANLPSSERDTLLSQLRAARGEIKKLNEYAQHKPDCVMRQWLNSSPRRPPCDCGFSSLKGEPHGG
jgi:hypothetical protein